MLPDIRISVESTCIRERQTSINKCEQHLSHRHATKPVFQSHMVKERCHIIYFVPSQTFLFVDAGNARYLDIWWVSGRLDILTAHINITYLTFLSPLLRKEVSALRRLL